MQLVPPSSSRPRSTSFVHDRVDPRPASTAGVTHKGPYGWFLVTAFGPVWITPSTGGALLARTWGILVTQGVGNMMTLDSG